MTTNAYLAVPTTPPTLIPLGMSTDDFQMLEDSIALWKPRICPVLATKDEPVTGIPATEEISDAGIPASAENAAPESEENR